MPEQAKRSKKLGVIIQAQFKSQIEPKTKLSAKIETRYMVNITEYKFWA